MAKYSYDNATKQSDFSQGVKTDQNTKITNLFTNTKDFKDVTTYKLMRGVPDFGSLVQFNPYETGYAAFIICQMPKFIELLAKYDAEYKVLLVSDFVICASVSLGFVVSTSFVVVGLTVVVYLIVINSVVFSVICSVVAFAISSLISSTFSVIVTSVVN